MSIKGESADQAALHATINGRVQGVAFRAFVRHKAVALGLTGYVRNLPGGQVEVFAEGNRDGLETLLDALKKGPPAARVFNVDVQWQRAEGRYRQFGIEYD